MLVSIGLFSSQALKKCDVVWIPLFPEPKAQYGFRGQGRSVQMLNFYFSCSLSLPSSLGREIFKKFPHIHQYRLSTPADRGLAGYGKAPVGRHGRYRRSSESRWDALERTPPLPKKGPFPQNYFIPGNLGLPDHLDPVHFLSPLHPEPFGSSWNFVQGYLYFEIMEFFSASMMASNSFSGVRFSARYNAPRMTLVASTRRLLT